MEKQTTFKLVLLALFVVLPPVRSQRGYCPQISYHQVAETRTRQTSQRHYTCCNWVCWSRCHSRTTYSTEFYTVYVRRSSSNFACCTGYRQIGSSCHPICNPGCQNGGTCTNPNVCSCPSGQWTGTRCQTPICELPCMNGGQCVGPNNCNCPAGWTEALCQRDRIECAEGTDGCEHICTNTEGSYNCSCRDGYILGSDGRTCEDINECLLDNGGCDQVCNNIEGSYACSCQSGYEFKDIDIAIDPINAGKECEDINECDSQNGGCDHICTNDVGSYECSCEDGYMLENDGRMCADTNECAAGLHNCSGLATCINEVGYFRCSCPTGYRLDDTYSTCVDIDECEEGISGCTQNCTNNEGSFVCSCNVGYLLESDGKTCTDIDECSGEDADDLCDHLCVNTIGSYVCDCHRGFTLSDDGINCSPRACPTLSAPQNGTISRCSLTLQTTGAECRFGCDAGFELTGSSSRFCRPSGQWSGSPTICQPLMCERLEPPDNGAVLPPCNYEFGSSCAVVCNFGYELESATNSSHQMCVLTMPEGDVVEWTEQPTCKEIDPCDNNPCMHNGVCTEITSELLNEVTFECDCEGTGYEGPTCNRGILMVPKIPKLEHNQQSSFEVNAATDMDLEINFESSSSRLKVTPSKTTLSARKSSAQFTLTGTRPGQYSLGYNLKGPGSDIFDPPGQSSILIGSNRPQSDINRYFSLLNREVGIITESCCQPQALLYQECPMTTDTVEFLSTCQWSEENPFRSNGIIFARFQSLSLPVSISGISVDYSEGTISTQVSGGFCSPCRENDKNFLGSIELSPEVENCYFFRFEAGDAEDLLVSHSLAKTYADRIRSLLPPWITSLSIPTTGDLTSSTFRSIDYFSNLAEQEDVENFEGCEHFVAEDPGLFSVLQYNWLFELNLGGYTLSYSPKSSQPLCLVVNLCRATESPIFVGIPLDLQSNIKRLPILEQYIAQGWSFTIDSVTLYNTSRSKTVSDSYWNGMRLYTPDLPDFNLRISTTASIAYSSVPQNLVGVQLDIIDGSLFYYFMINNNDERSGLLEARTSLTLTAQISGAQNTLALTSSGQSIIHTSAADSEVCSQGISLKMKYTPRIGQEFFSRLFSLADEYPQCDMDVFVNIDHSLDFHGVSIHMNEGCPRLRLDRLVFSEMTHTLYFSESSEFNSLCVQQSNIELGIQNSVFNIRSSLRNIPRLPLGSTMTLLPGPDSVALSVAYSKNDQPGYRARMHSVNVSILGTDITTPVDIRDGEISFTSEANLFNAYPAQLTVTASSNVPWNRMILSVMGKMDESVQQDVENYVQRYIENEIIGKALRRQRNAEMVVQRAKENLETREMELASREKNLMEANESYSEAVQEEIDAEANVNRAELVFNTANTELLIAQRSLNNVCDEDDCEDIMNKIEECKTCNEYEEVIVTGQCTELEPRTEYRTEIVGYRQVQRWRYFTVCYDYCYSQCYIFWSVRRCSSTCRGVCRRVTESEPIEEVVPRTIFEPVTRDCPRTVLRMSSPSTCCESYYETSPNVPCIQGCRVQRQAAIDRLQEFRQGLIAEPFQALDRAREELVAAKTTLSQAAVRRENAQRMRDQAVPPLDSAQTVQELSVQNQMELLSQIENELKLAQQFEMRQNDTEQIFRLTCISFNTEIANDPPLRIPLVLEYEAPFLGRNIEKTVVFDFTSSFELNMRSITDEIVEELLNVTSRLARRSIPTITKRQVNELEDMEIREREQNELTFEKNCIDLRNAEKYVSMLSNNLMHINDTTNTAKVTFEESIKDLSNRLNINSSELYALVNFGALESEFNITVNDTGEDTVPETLLNDKVILQYRRYIQDLLEITTNASDSVDGSLFSEWQASMEMLHNESKSAAGYSCTGFADCLDVVIDVVKSLIEDLGSQEEKQDLLNELEQAEINFMELATSMDLSIPEALTYVAQMLGVINADTLSVYWCSKPPIITASPPIHVNISSGSDLVLNCSAESELPSKFHWSKDNTPIPDTDSGTFVVTNVQRMDEGNYTCHVTNAVGRDDSLRTSVMVYVLPTFFLELSPLVTYAGNESGAVFACNASSYPNPGWRWYFRPTEEDPWEQIEDEDTNELMIPTPQPENEGWYTCEAFNYHGALRAKSARLTVLPVTVSQLSIGIEFQLVDLSPVENNSNCNIIESFRVFMEGRIQLGSASVTEAIATRNEIGYLVSFNLISVNVTNENTRFMILSDIENSALPSRGDVSNAREALQMAFLSEEGITLSCDALQYRPESSSLTFNTVMYVCPPGQELHSNFLLCVACAPGTYQGMTEAQRVFEGEGINERFSVCKPCPVGTYEDRVGSTQCKQCPEYHQTKSTGSSSQQDCYVDPLLFECSTSGTSTQVTVNCKSNRPPFTTLCSFDGGLEHECKWPLIINHQSSISTGNHSVTLTMRDSLGHVAQEMVRYFLSEEDQDLDSRLRPSLPRLGIQLINDSPRVQENSVEVDFILTRPASSVTCQLGNGQQEDCSSGSVVYSDLSSGKYFVRVQASNAKEDRAIIRRSFEIPKDSNYCTVHLINDGITVSESNLLVEFAGVGPAEFFECQLDRETSFVCTSPVELNSGINLESGEHRLKITPHGCGQRRRVTYKFNV